jgi:hypothetical protein
MTGLASTGRFGWMHSALAEALVLGLVAFVILAI